MFDSVERGSAMFRWMLTIKAEDNVSLSTMYEQLNLAPLESKLRLNCLRWYGHEESSDKWINKCSHLETDGFKGRVTEDRILKSMEH